MKRLGSLMLVLAILLALSACGRNAPAAEPGQESASAVNSAAESDIEEVISEPETEVLPDEAEPEESSVESAESDTEEAPTELIREVPLPISAGESLSMWIRLNFMDFDPIQL